MHLALCPLAFCLLGYFLVFHGIVLGIEEPMLKEQYGEAY
jgi:hypothetical protein